MGPAETAASIRVEVAYSQRAGAVQRLALTLPAGASVAQAVACTGWDLPSDVGYAVWGQTRMPGDVLRDRDRVEICRPLCVDPKEARRLRYHLQRAAK